MADTCHFLLTLSLVGIWQTSREMWIAGVFFAEGDEKRWLNIKTVHFGYLSIRLPFLVKEDLRLNLNPFSFGKD